MPRQVSLEQTRNIGIMLTSMPVKLQQQSVSCITLA